ncbi:MAG: hypothetical protein WAX29_04315 [Propionibacterium sp.]
MDVAVVGATGAVGRQMCIQLIERRIIPVSARLQLVARGAGSSGRAAHGLRADLIDAYAEHAPLIDVALDPREVVADVVVMAAGRNVPAAPGGSVDRRALAEQNIEVFRSYATELARNGSGHEVVIVVSNPVELAVAVFSSILGPHRVIGMGAWLDTLRFRREIASSLGIRRQSVGGFVTGQHGDDMVPLWSTVRITGLTATERHRALQELRGSRSLDDFDSELDRAKELLFQLSVNDMGRAFDVIEEWPPDLRLAARPWLTHQSGARTASGTAGAAVDLVDTIFDGREIVVAGQVRVDGDAELDGEPLRAVTGLPIVLGPEGWTRVILDPLAADEDRRLRQSIARTNLSLAEWGL